VASKGDALAEYGSVSIIGTNVDADGYEILYDIDGNETSDDSGMPDCPEMWDYGYEYNPDTGWCEMDLGYSEELLRDVPETGTISVTEMGIRLRVIF
jgi:hypothetical protein